MTRIEQANRRALVIIPQPDGGHTVIIESKRGKPIERIWLTPNESAQLVLALAAQEVQ